MTAHARLTGDIHVTRDASNFALGRKRLPECAHLGPHIGRHRVDIVSTSLASISADACPVSTKTTEGLRNRSGADSRTVSNGARLRPALALLDLLVHLDARCPCAADATRGCSLRPRRATVIHLVERLRTAHRPPEEKRRRTMKLPRAHQQPAPPLPQRAPCRARPRRRQAEPPPQSRARQLGRRLHRCHGAPGRPREPGWRREGRQAPLCPPGALRISSSWCSR